MSIIVIDIYYLSSKNENHLFIDTPKLTTAFGRLKVLSKLRVTTGLLEKTPLWKTVTAWADSFRFQIKGSEPSEDHEAV